MAPVLWFASLMHRFCTNIDTTLNYLFTKRIMERIDENHAIRVD